MSKYLILLVYIIIVSCDVLTYTSDEKPYTHVEEQEPIMTIDYNAEQDTFYVAGIVEFNYLVDLKGKEFSNIQILINEERIETTMNLDGFRFNTRYYPDGLHNLTINIIVYSGSGSLSDKLRTEKLISSSTKQIIIKNGLFENPFKITDIREFNGALKITWEKYPFYDFERADIIKRESVDGRPIGSLLTVGKVYDRDVNSYIDSTYVGGEFLYEIRVPLSNHQMLISEAKMFVDEPTQLVTVEAIDDEHLRVSWRKSKYYASLKNYKLLRADKHNSEINRYDEITSDLRLSDTSYIDKPGFGTEVFYSIASIGGEYFEVKSEPISNTLGVQGEAVYNELQYIAATNNLYINGNARINADTFAPMFNKSERFYIAESGEIGFTNNFANDVHNPTNSFTRINTETLEPIGQEIFTEQMLGYNSFNDFFSVTHNGYCFYTNDTPDDNHVGPTRLILVSPLEEELITFIDSDFFIHNIDISNFTDEGEYIIVGNSRIYNLKNKELTLLRVSDDYKIIGFLNSGKEYITQNDNVFSIYTCKDESLVKEFTTPKQLKHVTIDPLNNYLGGSLENEPHYEIYDTDTGNKVKEVQTFYNTLNGYLVNSSLISQYGYYIKINY